MKKYTGLIVYLVAPAPAASPEPTLNTLPRARSVHKPRSDHFLSSPPAFQSTSIQSYTSDSTYMKEHVPAHFQHRHFQHTKQLECIRGWQARGKNDEAYKL